MKKINLKKSMGLGIDVEDAISRSTGNSVQEAVMKKFHKKVKYLSGISQCPACYCMTHTTDEGHCGKCGALKITKREFTAILSMSKIPKLEWAVIFKKVGLIFSKKKVFLKRTPK